MNIKTKIGAIVTTGALMLGSVTPAFANAESWMPNYGWWDNMQNHQTQKPYHNPWPQQPNWQFPNTQTTIDVNTEINQESYTSFENNVSIIGSTGSSGGWGKGGGQPSGEFNATVHIMNTSNGNYFSLGQ